MIPRKMYKPYSRLHNHKIYDETLRNFIRASKKDSFYPYIPDSYLSAIIIYKYSELQLVKYALS